MARHTTFGGLHHPVPGRARGDDGAPTSVRLDGRTNFKHKGKQLFPRGRTVILDFPESARYGDLKDGDIESVKRDFAC